LNKGCIVEVVEWSKIDYQNHGFSQECGHNARGGAEEPGSISQSNKGCIVKVVEWSKVDYKNHGFFHRSAVTMLGEELKTCQDLKKQRMHC
jgi:hypothetical protein